MGLELNKKTYYISDWDITPGTYQFENHRYPQAYIELFPWHILNFKDIKQEITGSNNTIIANTPVHNEFIKLQQIYELVNDNDVFVGIEGAVWDWTEWPAREQELYIKILDKSAGVLYSNECDKKMMEIFASKFIQAPPCTNQFLETPREITGRYVFIVNPSKRYQRGMISHKLVHDTVNTSIPVYTMKYQRPATSELLSFPDSYTMPGFTQLDYMSHDKFLEVAYNSKFGIDIHRDYSAGTIAVNFGSIGVPLIGNIELDAQREIFPDTSFVWNDYNAIKKCIRLLCDDIEFSREVSKKALENTKNKYASQIVVNKFIDDFNKLKQ